MKEFVLTQNNARLRYHDLPGKNIPIVFIHGLGCASSFDYPQVASMKPLAEHRRILVDLLGSGYSDKPENFNYSIDNHVKYLKEFINELSLDHFIIFGHSMGGAVSISLAARCEQHLDGLILSEPNLDPGGGFYSNKIGSYKEEEYYLNGHDKIIKESIEDQNEEWAATLSVTSPRAIYTTSKSLIEGSDRTWRELFYSITCPRTYIFGELSLPDPEMNRLKSKHIHIEIVKNAGHSMAWENPEGLAAAIKNGIKQFD